ncbi:Fpg/Nei family DNA glycosylase [Glutamicibacter uratoxydans]|uniref:Fpg/Nei family DNA glycosylase n=1 Tax=Glutamicibacter uratoxydans TaxID=43667 RepID=UPI003D6F5B3B
MPEGHSLHRLSRQFDDAFGNQIVSVTSPQGRFATDARRLDGRRLETAWAKGKQLFIQFDNELFLRVHLGLYGAVDFGGDEHFRGASSIGAPRRIGERELTQDAAQPYSGPPEPVGQVRARFVSEHGWADLRGPSACEVLDWDQVQQQLQKLGPDPLVGAGLRFAQSKGRDLDLDPLKELERGYAEFRRNLSRTKTPIGIVLMNQALISGVGNIYRAEALFRAKVDPQLAANEVSTQAAKKMWWDLVELMEDGVREGKIITTREADRDPFGPVWPDNAYYVYQRQGLKCRRCSAQVALAEVAGRKLYWCGRCQRPPRKRS